MVPIPAQRSLQKLSLIAALAALLLGGVVSWAPQAGATTTYVVNSPADPGDSSCDAMECTLREALIAANADTDPSTITFDIEPGRLQTISPTSSLPEITAPVTIDGTTQPGFAGYPIIELNGSGAADYSDGLHITGGRSTVRGLVINRFRGDGIEIAAAGGNVLQGNYIGTDPSGTVDLGNGGDGVRMYTPSNIVGGTDIRARNVISGNGLVGVDVGNTGNRIEGNYIGTDASGTVDLGNSDSGVAIGGNGPPWSIVGGTAPGAGNVISGNDNSGVDLFSDGSATDGGIRIEGNYIGTDASGTVDIGNSGAGVYVIAASFHTVGGTAAGAGNIISGNGRGIYVSLSSRNRIEGNYIGTDAGGTADLGNSGDGVLIEYSNFNTVGGTAAGAGNVISGNGRTGVLITGSAPPYYTGTGNRVEGNHIGTDVGGTAPLGNSGQGVAIVDAPSNTIGGTAAGAGNVISGNGRNGVAIIQDGAVGNLVRGNSIFSNSGLGIDLALAGVTANDPGDTDIGANDLQNFPALTSAASGGGVISLRGTLNSTPGTTFALEFFSNSACDPSGHGEGERFLESTTVMTDDDGNATFAVSLTAVPPGRFVTATATNPSGSTSEFSHCRVVRRSSGSPGTRSIPN
jgi:CSLREA domain-containing protein